jgi:Immunity protein Imm5
VSLPPSIAEMISRAAEHIDENGDLSVPFRAELHRRVEAKSVPYHPRAGYYRRCKWSFTAAACAIPLWRDAGHSDEEVKHLLELSRSALKGQIPLANLQVQAERLWEHFVDLGCDQPKMQIMTMAPLAAIAAAATVVYDIDLTNYEQNHRGESPELWEAAWFASVAAAGGTVWHEGSSVSARRSFWLHHVEVSLPAVWPPHVEPISVA